MAERNWQCEALVLQVQELSSAHKVAKVLLNSQDGTSLLNATIFGGAKSRLSSLVFPYYTGIMYIYTNPIKEANKVVDFDVRYMRFGIRESLYRIWAASFATELCIKMSSCIEWNLMNAFLDGISISSDEECKIAILRFIWRVALSSGLAPSFEHCAQCKKQLDDVVYFDHALGEFFCETCCEKKISSTPLSKEACDYLYKIAYKAPKEARLTALSSEAFTLLTTFLHRFALDMAGCDLYSLSPKNPVYMTVCF